MLQQKRNQTRDFHYFSIKARWFAAVSTVCFDATHFKYQVDLGPHDLMTSLFPAWKIVGIDGPQDVGDHNDGSFK